MDIKDIDFETRVELENITKVGSIDGVMVFMDSAKASWEYASCGKFGKMIKDLTIEQKAELQALSKTDMSELATRARETYENPSQG